MADLTLRRPTDADIPRLVELLVSCDIDEMGAAESDEEDVVWRWRIPGFDRDRDAVIATSGGRIVGYALAFEGEAVVTVAPWARGRGIGSVLASACEVHIAARGSSDGFVRQNSSSRVPAAIALLEGRGYEESHHYARMEIELSAEPKVPGTPPGVTIRGFRSGDEHAFHEANMAAWSQYADRWEPETFERWSANYLAGEDFDPSLWWMAESSGRTLGISICLPYPSMGWIQVLGTIPEARGRGIGTALLQRSFATYWERGVKRIGLTANSQNIPEVRRLYERNGMTEVLRYINHRKPIS